MSESSSRLAERAAELRRAFDRSFSDQARRDTTPTEDLLAIRIGPEPYAIRASEIAGLFADKSITPIPSRAPALLGVGGFRGTIVPVYSLPALLGHPMGAAPRWIVIASGLPVALAFEALDGHLRVSRDRMVGREAGGQARKYVHNFMREHDRVRAIVHLPSLLATISEQRAG
jgi:chemotaxis signal transduction protein